MNPTQVGVNALPIQGKRDAPRTFKGSYDQVEDFLKTMDKLFARYQVTLDDEKVEAILPYCSSKVQDFVRSSPSFTTPNWNELKEDMMEYYDAERATLKFSPKHIGGFIKMWNAMEITDLVQWKKYYREFFSMARVLVNREEISEKDFKTYFWLGLPKSTRLKFEPILQAQIKNYDASVPYTIDQIRAVARNYFQRNKFTDRVVHPLDYELEDNSDSDSEESSSSSESESDYNRKKKKKYKKKPLKRTKHTKRSVEKERPTQQYQGPEQEIEGMIQQLNTMSLNDPTYGHLYFKVMRLDTSGIAQKCIYREPLRITQPQVTPAATRSPMVATGRPLSSPQKPPATFPNNLPTWN